MVAQAEDRIEPGRPKVENEKQDQTGSDKKAWSDRFRACTTGTRVVQDQARTGRYRKGEEASTWGDKDGTIAGQGQCYGQNRVRIKR